ncbi:hypothetical protein AB0I84_23280 [Streptomyces spectabilis]|uniref:hypothetical protein n=1 Tax=Streptomyces spectabilis TaxID=68270 RepID=UPI0033FF2719
MLLHHDRGSHLSLTYPAWRPQGDSTPPLVPLRTTVDDGSPVADPFDAVFLCRSGAWVPSWCDDQFTDLLTAFPGHAELFPGSEWTHPRPDPLPDVRRIAAAVTELHHRAKARQLPAAPVPQAAAAHPEATLQQTRTPQHDRRPGH